MDRAKIEHAVAGLRRAWEQVGDRLTAVEALLADEATPSQTAKVLLGHFRTQWARRYAGQTYAVTSWAGEMSRMKKLLGTTTADDVTLRISVYLMNDAPFYAKAHHPLGLFFRNFNEFGPEGAPAEFTLGGWADKEMWVRDCLHMPRCRTEQEHTRARVQDARR